MARAPRKPWLTHESRILVMALAAGLPGAMVSMLLLWLGDHTPKVQWTLTVLIVGLWFGFAFALRERVIYPLQTLSNLLAALREGDFSVRGRTARQDDALGEVMREVNTLSGTLQEQRLGALEATTILRTVMKEINVAIFAFDDESKLRLVNRAGERLLGAPGERLLGLAAADVHLAQCLQGEEQQTFRMSFPGGTGRWGMRRSTVRERGMPLELVVISDITQPLREEELQAWQRLVRVLGHELNNSLTPIKSIAGSLKSLLGRRPLAPDWEEDTQRGLDVITARAEALSRFIGAYARLAKLPRPQLQPLDVGGWVERTVGMETRLKVTVCAGPRATIHVDPDQLEQVLINLLRNAADAALETGGGVQVNWRLSGGWFELAVEDDGPGLHNTANLFVPFFTTKPGGSGIGLVLSRQIAEAHGGGLMLENRQGATGCVARLRLPA